MWLVFQHLPYPCNHPNNRVTQHFSTPVVPAEWHSISAPPPPISIVPYRLISMTRRLLVVMGVTGNQQHMKIYATPKLCLKHRVRKCFNYLSIHPSSYLPTYLPTCSVVECSICTCMKHFLTLWFKRVRVIIMLPWLLNCWISHMEGLPRGPVAVVGDKQGLQWSYFNQRNTQGIYIYLMVGRSSRKKALYGWIFWNSVFLYIWKF